MALSLDEIQARAREVFRLEAADLLSELEAALLALEDSPTDEPAIHRVFRVMHTLKGSGATSGFADLSGFLHHVEDVYNAAREGRLVITREIIDLTLGIGDTVRAYLEAETPAVGAAVLRDAAPGLQSLLGLLACASAAKSAAAAPAPRPAFAPVAPPHTVHASLEPLPGAALPSSTSPTSSTSFTSSPEHVRHLRFAPRAHLYRTGAEPGPFLDDLRRLGPCDIRVVADALPTLAELDAESCHLAWDVTFEPPVPRAAVEDVFLFVADDCVLTYGAPPAAATAPATALSPSENFSVSGAPSASADDSPASASASAPAASPASAAAPAAESSRVSKNHDTLRVSADRLDRLVNLIGELVILRSVLSSACVANPGLPRAIHDASETLQTLATQLRDEILNIRMTPIGQTFAKFQRLTRDLSRELGKDIELVVEGADTEMDKNVLDQLADPLVHLVRNSLDHGLETPAERIAAGKSPRGRLRLAAEQKGDRVLVTVSDDGRGLDPARIRAKALERGLISPDARLTESEIHQLVFLPGFSTADRVSQLSGRGVGLDVVRRHVEQLRGRVELRSTPGRGAEFRLSLPLTLAIIDGFLVAVGRDRYVLPLGAARETIDLPPGHAYGSGRRNVVSLRDQPVPFLRLRELFGLGPPPAGARERIVIVDTEDSRLGLVVDEVLGNHQTVIKSLGWLAPRVDVFCGATVLGDGAIALILDLPRLFARVQRSTAAATAPATAAAA